MYQGKNPSALRSKNWLEEALLALLEEKKYESITIKEICEKADLSRQTFYQIFESKEEILSYHFSILFEEFAQGLAEMEIHTVFDISRQFFLFFYKHRDFVEILIVNHLTYMLDEQFKIYLNKIDVFRHAVSDASHVDYITAYVVGALTQILLHWFEQGFDLSVDELSALIEEIIVGRYFEAEL